MCAGLPGRCSCTRQVPTGRYHCMNLISTAKASPSGIDVSWNVGHFAAQREAPNIHQCSGCGPRSEILYLSPLPSLTLSPAAAHASKLAVSMPHARFVATLITLLRSWKCGALPEKVWHCPCPPSVMLLATGDSDRASP